MTKTSREAFEAWAEQYFEYEPLHRSPIDGNQYAAEYVQDAWMAWAYRGAKVAELRAELAAYKEVADNNYQYNAAELYRCRCEAGKLLSLRNLDEMERSRLRHGLAVAQAFVKEAIDDLVMRANMSRDKSLNISQGVLDRMHAAIAQQKEPKNG